MVLCFVFGCNHQGLRDRCSFFRFPKSHWQKWEKLCRRSDRSLDVVYDRICSCHFKDGHKENTPTLFPWNDGKFMDFPDPNKIRRKASPEQPPEDMEETEGACGGVSLDTQLNQAHLSASLDHSYHSTYVDIVQNNKDLKKKVDELELELKALRIQKRAVLTIKEIQDDERKMLMYTSLKYDMFKVVDDMVQRFPLTYVEGWTPASIDQTDQLLLTLIKLTMNTPMLDLACRFGTSKSTVNNIFMTHVYALHEIFYQGFIEGQIPSLMKCKGSMPASFGDFSSCRLVIDATEISQDVPGNHMGLHVQSKTYSSYKNNHTVKSVTGVAPNGAIVYISKLYPGSASDVAIVEHSRMLSLLEPGDMVLADKGFTIHKLMPQGVHLNIPPFLIGKSQYTPAEVKLCRTIAKSRIHVERANERIKNYSILDHIPQQYRAASTKIFQVCCTLVNFQDPLILEVCQNYIMESSN